SQIDNNDKYWSSVVESRDGQTVWIAQDKNLIELDISGTIISKHNFPKRIFLAGSGSRQKLWGYVKEGNAFVKGRNQELEFNVLDSSSFGKNISFDYEFPVNNFVHSPWDDKVWFSEPYSKNCLIFDAKQGLVYDLKEHFEDILINEVYWNSSNVVLVGTTNGIYIIRLVPNAFQKYLATPNSQVPKYSTRGIIHDKKGNLHIGTYRGRWVIDSLGTITEFSGKLRNILFAEEAKNGDLWFGAESNYVECYNQDSEQFLYYAYEEFEGIPLPEQPFQPTQSFYEDDENRIWIGTNRGLYQVDKTRQVLVKENIDLLNEQCIDKIVEYSGALWMGTENGIFAYNPKSKSIEHFHKEGKGDYYLAHDEILDIHIDKQGVFWLGTRGGGLLKWSPHDVELHDEYTISNGLSNNIIYAVYEDDYNSLWLSSNYGLMNFYKENELVNVYFPRDGLSHEEFNAYSHYQAADGKLYMGGLNGVNAFYPKQLHSFSDKEDTKLQITSFRLLNGSEGKYEEKTSELVKSQEITLNESNHSFYLSFSLLNYWATPYNKYAYKFSNLGEEWTYIEENFIRIHRLPYGTHTLEIKAQGENGKWLVDRIRLKVVMNPPIYLMGEFWIAIVFCIIVLVYLYFRWRVNYLQRSKVKLEKEVGRRTRNLLDREQELLKAKELAEKNSKAKAEFLSIMSHELRTPMNAVIGIKNLLLEDSPKKEQIKDLGILKSSASHLLAIINDILDYNKIEFQKIELEELEFDIYEILAGLEYTTKIGARTKGIFFRLETDKKIQSHLVGDPTRLTQILYNLTSNALKFTEEGGIVLRSELVDEDEYSVNIRFSVIDTGIGVSEDKQKQIFELFTQARSDISRRYGGTGLGLAITKRLLELKNSDIYLESEYGLGSNFYFTLNLKKGSNYKDKVEPKATQKEVKLLSSEAVPTNKRILLVEDNKINMLVVTRFLKHWQIDYAWAKDGQEALDMIQQQHFDLVLMDIQMPVMNGYEASKAIRELPGEHYQNIPIVALTASALKEERDRVSNAGMNDHITKPFNPMVFKQKILKYFDEKDFS
ncbi:MAG: response regulator, partial [Saprospiraceae bacterium]|nr:response regulator [Saprospiraceae bacterium]